VADTTWDDAAIEEMLNTPEGLVGQFIIETSEQIAAVARSKVQIRRSRSWSARSDANPPGYTLGTIRPWMGYTGGHIYGGANAAADPAIFLEKPRIDRNEYPFLTTGLWSIAEEL
jgi:hypothetical protein